MRDLAGGSGLQSELHGGSGLEQGSWGHGFIMSTGPRMGYRICGALTNKSVRPLVKNMIINFKTKCRTLVTTGVTDPEWPFPVLEVKA